MMRMDIIHECEDETLIEELKERGYAVYKNEEMLKEIGKLETVKRKFEEIRRLRGK